MSTNSKNTIRPEFFKNFTKKVKERYILVEKGDKHLKNINDLVCSINQNLNCIIQTLNLKITDRQLPYITLKVCYGNLSNRRIRVFIHDDDTDFLYERDVQAQIEEETEISHILDLLIASSLKKITISALSCDAEIVIDYKLLQEAIIDILLDIVMFNSYSFLKNMDMAAKKDLVVRNMNILKTITCHAFMIVQKINCCIIQYLFRLEFQNLNLIKINISTIGTNL